MDKRKSYYIILDTETAPFDNTIKEVDSKNMVTYDIGFCVVDKKGNVYESHSYIIKEIFFNNNLMRSAYYYNKVPQYLSDIIKGDRIVESFFNVQKILFDIFEKWNCKAIISHNAIFDYNSLTTTLQYLTNKQVYYFPYNFPYWDSLKMARDVLKTRKTYKNFCEKYNFMTKHKKPRPQLKAEVIYKFLTNNPDFIESHTGLEDCLIENEIVKYCFNSHKKMRKELFNR